MISNKDRLQDSVSKPFKLSSEGEAFVKSELKRYETPRSAILPALYRVQSENGGWVSPESVVYLAQLMDLPEAWINEVLHFYTMYNKRPVGRHHLQVCSNVSCYMAGSEQLVKALCEHFKCKPEELSPDQKVTVSRVECLGSCGTAPMLQLGDRYYESLTVQSVLDLVKKLE